MRGTTGELSVRASASTNSAAKISYAWYSSTTETGVGGSPLQSGDTLGRYAIPSASNAAPQVGTYYYYAVASAAGYTAVQSTRAKVVVTPNPELTVPDSLPTTMAGYQFTYTLTANGTSPIAWSVTGAPSWLTLNAATGVLSGKAPTTAKGSVYTLTVSASNGYGTPSKTTTLRVIDPFDQKDGKIRLVDASDNVVEVGTVAAYADVAEYAFQTLRSIANPDVTIKPAYGKVSDYVVSEIVYAGSAGTYTFTSTNGTKWDAADAVTKALVGRTKTADKHGVLDAGTYTVYAKVVGKGATVATGKDALGYSRPVTYRVTPKDIKSASMTVTIAEKNSVYDGTEKEPIIKVTDGANALDLGVDYSIASHTPAEWTNAGTVTVVANGEGNYKGSVSKTFTIKKAALRINTAATYSFVKEFDGTAAVDTSATPLVIEFVNAVGEPVALALGADYTVSNLRYNSETVGTDKTVSCVVKLNATGMGGNYSLASTSFSVSKQVITKSAPKLEFLTVTPAAVAKDGGYELMYLGKAVTVTAVWKSGINNNGSRITVKYGTEDGKAPVLPGQYSVTADITEGANLLAAADFPIGTINILQALPPVVDPTTPPDTLYHATESVTLSVKAANPVDGKTTGLTYQWYEASDTGNVLLRGKTAASLLLNSTIVGTTRYAVKVTYKSSVQDTASAWSRAASVTVLPAPVALRGAVITANRTYEYSGSEIKPTENDFTVTLGNASLQPGSDFVIASYSGNVSAGEGIVTLKGIGSYKDTEKGTFTITKKQVTLDDLNITYVTEYNGEAQPIKVVAKSGLRGLGAVTAKYEPDTLARLGAGSWNVTLSIADGVNYLGTEAITLSQPYTISKVFWNVAAMISTPDLPNGKKEVAWTGENQGIAAPTFIGVAAYYTGKSWSVVYERGGDELDAAVDSGTYTVKMKLPADENFRGDEVTLGRVIIHGANWVIAVAEGNREIPGKAVVEEAAVAPVAVSSGSVTVGPSPVRAGGSVSVFWSGSKSVTGKLGVFDALGKKVAEVKVAGTKRVGEWSVGSLSEGTYLVRGVLKDKDGVKVKVSAPVSVVR